MKIFLAGATGAIGRRLVPVLLREGHTVTGMTHTESKAAQLRSTGADAVIVDALDPTAVAHAVERAKPDAIVHELTAIPAAFNPRKFREQFHLTNRLRTEATDHLLAAARAFGVHRFVAQSYAGWPYARTGGAVKTEEDPLDPNPAEPMRETLGAIEHVETAVPNTPGIEGLVLRYGALYGPGNALGAGGSVVKEVRRRHLPIIGKGTGVWSFLHIDDAAEATAAAVAHGNPGVYNIADDDPAPVSEWLPLLAEALGAKPPLHVPKWLGSLMAGEVATVMMTEQRGASNQKAKREFAWRPMWVSWREGFRRALGDTAPGSPSAVLLS